MLDELGHLRCEIKELEMEIEDHKNSIQGLYTLLEIKQRKLDELRVKTLEEKIIRCMVDFEHCVYPELLDNITERVREWVDEEWLVEKHCEYDNGWNDCIIKLRSKLK
jgi:hypothetical protein